MWEAVRFRRSSLQRDLALKLTMNAGIVIPEEGCGIYEIQQFQRYLAAENLAIMVYGFKDFGRGGNLIYDGRTILASLEREPNHCLNIMYYEGRRHYNTILNLKAAAGSQGGYCVACNVGYRPIRGHRCSKRCPRCYAIPSCEHHDAEKVRCDTCNRTFFGNSCFERHRTEKSYEEKSTVCHSVKICNNCGRFIKSSLRHECNSAYCRICRSQQPVNHLCFMQPLRRRVEAEDPGEGTSAAAIREEAQRNANEGENDNEVKGAVAFVFYDFETRQDETYEGTENVKLHVPTLCVAQQICAACVAIDDMTVRCRWCGTREFVFNIDPVKQFIEFVTRPTKHFKSIICIVHNAKAFDAQFILKYLVEKSLITEKPRIILNGTKIIVMTIGHTKFIDSVNYMPMRLSDLPKAFGLRDTADKGIFPHLFNTVENQSYVGPLPETRFYSPDQMKSDERERFLAWHTEMTNKNVIFDFQREIVRYCRNDVDILRRACVAFQKIFLERGGVCPFEECTTIASTCMKVFRKNFLREGEIGIIPPGGYRNADRQSRKALQWLVWKERELGHPINHAGRGRERLIGGSHVDGYYETKLGTETQRFVLQFDGCFWHGCLTCFQVNRDSKLSTANRDDTIETRYERTIATTWRLRRQGYQVIEKWECAFDREMRANNEMRNFLEHHPILKSAPLDPRDAFFGGRTENIVTRLEVAGYTEKIRYVDVCSLYPYVLKTGVFRSATLKSISERNARR
ncbi:uncharacterized protein LOC120359012 [Solenopsis invicta]|uniref:uncharacterized protein LOC120359012 n=1 Tax=Solenopsis invicta TaxID=13686 RepID=UPI00193D2E92|nr:uncharacterized protein LOC120359012 [Solenopsis invicta]